MTGSEKRRIYDGMDVVYERDGSNNFIAKYVRDGNIGGILAKKSGTSYFYFHYDGSGNVSNLTDSAQATVATYDYDAWGNSIIATGVKASNNAYRYSSKEFFAQAGLYNFGYRFYSAGLGRWINRDPIEEDGGINLYAMVANDPVSRWDEYGLAAGDQFNEQIASVKRQIAGLEKDIAEHFEELKRVRPPHEQLPMTAPGDDLKPGLSRASHARTIKKEVEILAQRKTLLNNLLRRQEAAIARFAARGAGVAAAKKACGKLFLWWGLLDYFYLPDASVMFGAPDLDGDGVNDNAVVQREEKPDDLERDLRLVSNDTDNAVVQDRAKPDDRKCLTSFY